MEDKITQSNESQLIADVQSVKEFVAARKSQQITYPLDFQSRQTLQRYFPYVKGILSLTGASAIETDYLVLTSDGRDYAIPIIGIISFTVDTSTDTVIASGGAYAPGNVVSFLTGGSLPSPLDSALNYYVYQVSAAGFTLSQQILGFSFTSAFMAGATSGTLTANWDKASGTYVIFFGLTENGATEIRRATFTDGSPSVTWSGGLTYAEDEEPGIGHDKTDITTNGSGFQYISQ